MTYRFVYSKDLYSNTLYSFETTDRATAISTLHSLVRDYSEVALCIDGLRGQQLAMEFGKGSFWQRLYGEEFDDWAW